MSREETTESILSNNDANDQNSTDRASPAQQPCVFYSTFLGFWRRCTRNLEGRMQRHKFAALPYPHENENDTIADGDALDRYFVFVSGSVNAYARLCIYGWLRGTRLGKLRCPTRL